MRHYLTWRHRVSWGQLWTEMGSGERKPEQESVCSWHWMGTCIHSWVHRLWATHAFTSRSSWNHGWDIPSKTGDIHQGSWKIAEKLWWTSINSSPNIGTLLNISQSTRSQNLFPKHDRNKRSSLYFIADVHIHVPIRLMHELCKVSHQNKCEAACLGGKSLWLEQVSHTGTPTTKLPANLVYLSETGLPQRNFLPSFLQRCWRPDVLFR